MPDLADVLRPLVRGGLSEAFLSAEENLGPLADVEPAVASASSSWERFVDRVLLPVLREGFVDAYRAVRPDGPLEDAWAAHVASVRPRLVSVPARLLNAVRAALVAAESDGSPLLAAALDALDGLTDGDWRPDRVARTEASAATSGARLAAALGFATQTGEALDVVWRAHDDERTRPSHADLDGASAVAGEPFRNGCRYPGDPLGPPEEVVNCRCSLDVDLSLTAGAPMSEPTLASTTPGSEPQYAGLPDGWRGCLAPLGVPSGDGRIIARVGDEPRVRPLPLPMQWQRTNEGRHDGAVVAARLDRVWYEHHDDRDCLHGEGPLDVAGEDGQELARRMKDAYAGGVSVDLVDVTAEFHFVLPDGTTAPEPQSLEEYLDLLMSGAEEVMVATDWQLGTATHVVIPAFAEARVEPVYGYSPVVAAADTVVASLPGEFVYDAEAFRVPEADRPTPLTITDDGRVFGHAALWGTCHVGFPGQCVTAPKSRSGYAHFHLGAVPTTDGELAVGKITVGGGHADTKLGVRPTLEHYDNAAASVAVVRASDGRHGIWLSGHLLPDASPRDVARLRSHPISGDWRRAGGALELVAAHAVVVPGFPVPRAMAASVGTAQVSLVAAGITPDLLRRPSETPTLPSATEFAREVIRAMREHAAADAQADQLAREVGLDPVSQADALAARVGITPGDG